MSFGFFEISINIFLCLKFFDLDIEFIRLLKYLLV